MLSNGVITLVVSLVLAGGWAMHVTVLYRELGAWRTDPITHLPVRRAFYRQVRKLRLPGTVLLLIDLDQFKPINDTLGHQAGDQVLAIIGTRLRAALGPGAVLGRLGGDEFAAALCVGPAHTAWPVVLHRLLRLLVEPIALADLSSPLTIGASIGAVHLGRLRQPRLSRALQLADEQMYLAKRTGGGLRAVVADPDDHILHTADHRPTRRRHSGDHRGTAGAAGDRSTRRP